MSDGGRSGTLSKALTLIQFFIDGQDAWGVRELAAALDQPTSSTHRLLRTLRIHGIVTWDEARQRYALGPEINRWSAVLRARQGLAAMVRPFAEDLVSVLGESCWFAVYDSSTQETWYDIDVRSPHPLHQEAPIGRRTPLAYSSAGIAVLSQLDSSARARALEALDVPTRNRLSAILDAGEVAGVYQIEDMEDDDAPVVLAAPIMGPRGLPAGALAVAVPAHRYVRSDASRIGDPLVAAARRISRMLGARLLTGSGAAGSQPGLAAIANVIRDQVTDLQLTPWTRGGNTKLSELEDGMAAYCTAVGPALDAAYLGKNAFRRPHKRLRTVMALGQLSLHILVARDSTVERLDQIRGHRISAGEADYATASLFSDVLRAALPEAGEDVLEHLAHLDYAEANRRFEAGQLDVLVSLNTTPNPAYVRLNRTRPFRLLEVPMAALKELLSTEPSLRIGYIDPAGYPGSAAAPVATLCTPLVITTTEDRSSDEVEEVVSAIWRRLPELATASPVLSHVEPLSPLETLSVPVHEGALRFYREKGMD